MSLPSTLSFPAVSSKPKAVNVVVLLAVVTSIGGLSCCRPVLACLVVTVRVKMSVATSVSINVIVFAFPSGPVEGVTVAKSAFFTVTVIVSIWVSRLVRP